MASKNSAKFYARSLPSGLVSYAKTRRKRHCESEPVSLPEGAANDHKESIYDRLLRKQEEAERIAGLRA